MRLVNSVLCLMVFALGISLLPNVAEATGGPCKKARVTCGSAANLKRTECKAKCATKKTRDDRKECVLGCRAKRELSRANCAADFDDCCLFSDDAPAKSCVASCADTLPSCRRFDKESYRACMSSAHETRLKDEAKCETRHTRADRKTCRRYAAKKDDKRARGCLKARAKIRLGCADIVNACVADCAADG